MFAADSSSEDEGDSSDDEIINIPPVVRTVSPPTKSSSIVSLQAGPSELDANISSSSSEDETNAISEPR